MLTDDLQISINKAIENARGKRHGYITVEHLLLLLLDDESALDVLVSCGADIDSLRTELGSFVDATTPLAESPRSTAGFTRVLNLAIAHTQASGKKACSGCQRAGGHLRGAGQPRRIPVAGRRISPAPAWCNTSATASPREDARHRPRRPPAPPQKAAAKAPGAVRHRPLPRGQRGAHRPPGGPRRRSCSAWPRCWRGGARTIPCWWANPGSAKPP